MARLAVMGVPGLGSGENWWKRFSVPHVHVGWNKAVDLNKGKVYFKNRFLGKHCFIGV